MRLECGAPYPIPALALLRGRVHDVREQQRREATFRRVVDAASKKRLDGGGHLIGDCLVDAGDVVCRVEFQVLSSGDEFREISPVRNGVMLVVPGMQDERRASNILQNRPQVDLHDPPPQGFECGGVGRRLQKLGKGLVGGGPCAGKTDRGELECERLEVVLHETEEPRPIREPILLRHRQIGIPGIATDAIHKNQVSHASGKLQRIQDRHGRALRQPEERNLLRA
ncbi:hypothetical protein LMG28138_03572 [Pararobbsia alpina]|uniref:Uncharacterized protein n=1 Tax=Pararobbsia alpina TaxID=621374 RepID=A0A6S7BSF8_9BURK|nr:hypothetical protein LMG28138_03572 [Pararobbsia alpina]